MPTTLNRYTANHLANGVVIGIGDAAVNGAGSATVDALRGTGTGEIITAGDGIDFWIASGGIRRIDTLAETAGKTQVMQALITVPAGPVAHTRIFESRSSSAAAGRLVVSPSRHVYYETAAGAYPVSQNHPPVLTAGARYLVDYIISQHTSPTTSNGRVIERITPVNDPTWNSGAAWYYDSGNTLNFGTALDRVRFGANGGEVAQATPIRMEQIGWKTLTDDLTSVTTRSAVENYFGDNPLTAPNVAPAVSITSETPSSAQQNSTVPLRGTATDSDGTIASVAWSISSWPNTISGPPVISNPGSLTNASFVAVAPGDHNIRLTVVDDDGAQTVANKTVTVTQATGSGDNVEYLVMVNGSVI